MNRTRTRTASLVLVGALLVGGAAGCAKDDGAATRAGCGVAGTGSGSAAGSASVTGKATGRPLKVTVDEWTVKAPKVTKSGKVLLTVTNNGKDTHEVVVVEGVTLADLQSKADGELDESKLPKGAVLGEVEGVKPGATCDGGFTLKPGNYVLVCNLTSKENGKDVSHFMKGMSTEMKAT